MAHHAHRPLAVRLVAAAGCRERESARAVSRLRPGRDRLARRERGGHAPRREGRGVPRARSPRRPRARRDRRAHALRVHERGHQLRLVCADRPARGDGGVAAEAACRDRDPARDRPDASRRGDARPHPRSAGDPHHDGQGARRVRLAPRARRSPDRRVRVSRQVLGRDRHLVGAPGGRTRRRLARAVALVHRGSGHRLQRADHPDRIARLAGRAVRPGASCRRHPAQSRDGHLDLHLPGVLRADPCRGCDRLVDDAAQDQPDPLRERRGQPRDLGRTAGDPRLDPRDLATAARPHRLHDAAEHRRRARALAAGPGQPAARARRDLAGSAGAGCRSRRELGGAGRGDPDRRSGRDRGRALADHRPLCAAEGPHARAPGRRRAARRSSSRASTSATPRSSACSRSRPRPTPGWRRGWSTSCSQ